MSTCYCDDDLCRRPFLLLTTSERAGDGIQKHHLLDEKDDPTQITVIINKVVHEAVREVRSVPTTVRLLSWDTGWAANRLVAPSFTVFAITGLS